VVADATQDPHKWSRICEEMSACAVFAELMKFNRCRAIDVEAGPQMWKSLDRKRISRDHNTKIDLELGWRRFLEGF